MSGLTPSAKMTFCEQHGHAYEVLNSNYDGRLIKSCMRCDACLILVQDDGRSHWRSMATTGPEDTALEVHAGEDEACSPATVSSAPSK